MKSMQFTSHVGEDGVLNLQMPVGITDREVDVVVAISPRPLEKKENQSHGWPPGFFEETAGTWAGEPLVRPPQGELETREELD